MSVYICIQKRLDLAFLILSLEILSYFKVIRKIKYEEEVVSISIVPDM